MTATQLIVTIVFAVCASPFIIYHAVKLGAYGYLKGRQLFFEEKQKQEKKNGS